MKKLTLILSLAVIVCSGPLAAKDRHKPKTPKKEQVPVNPNRQTVVQVKPKATAAKPAKPVAGQVNLNQKKFSLRRPGESRTDMLKRLYQEQLKRDPYEKRQKAARLRHEKTKEMLRNAAKTGRNFVPKKTQNQETFCDDFDQNFVGFWILDSIDDWSNATLLEFYRDANGDPHVKFHDGTQKHIREETDDLPANVPVSPAGSDIPVELLSATSLRFFNTPEHLSTDDLRSTMKIQDNDPNTAFCQFWTDWDGSADDARYGTLENLTQFRRLPARPEIQLNRLPSPTDWTNPVNIFSYINEYYQLLGQPEKAVDLNQEDYLGWENANALFDKFLTTGVKRSIRTSSDFRGGNYIGVWKTQYPEDFPITTIHTDGFHHLTAASKVAITGFKGVYNVLNGEHILAPLPAMTVDKARNYPWADGDSKEQLIHIQLDTSAIEEPYDPNIHGTGLIQAQHGPVTPDIQYREFLAATLDFIESAYGSCTHVSPRAWIRDDLTIPETWQELKQGLADGTISMLYTNRTRSLGHGEPDFYWNANIFGGSLGFPEFDINDPFGLGESFLDPNYDIDIVLENYLDPSKIYSTFFTITGPELPDEPITSQLIDNGYTSNGSQVVFVANHFQQVPPPLVDAYGVHPWSFYAAADNDPETILFESHYNLVGGLVDRKYTCGKTVAYIRVGDEDAFDSPLYVLSTRSLAFGRSDMASKMNSNWTAAMAALLEKLNKCHPDRYIIDIRPNAGGFANVPSAFAALFGGNRPGLFSALTYPGDGQRGPTPLLGSGIQTAFDSLEVNASKDALIDTDEAAAVFPKSIVRGNCTPIEVIILTSCSAGSGGDVFPHLFIGSDSGSLVHDLGNNVTCRIIGEIDGRLFSGVKGFDNLAVDPLNHNLHSPEGEIRSAFYPTAEAGLVISDRFGSLVNQQVWTRPAILLNAWYDATQWQDIGVIPINVPYPLGSLKADPDNNDNSTFRDLFLEYAIAE